MATNPNSPKLRPMYVVGGLAVLCVLLRASGHGILVHSHEPDSESSGAVGMVYVGGVAIPADFSPPMYICTYFNGLGTVKTTYAASQNRSQCPFLSAL